MNQNALPDDAVDATRSRRGVSSNYLGRGQALSGKVRIALFSTSARPRPTLTEDTGRLDLVLRRRVCDATTDDTVTAPERPASRPGPSKPLDPTVPVVVATVR